MATEKTTTTTTAVKTRSSLGGMNRHHAATQQQQQQQQTPTSQYVQSESSSMSIYERVRNFVQINFALNKRTLIISILSYFADIMLFIALNLYLFSNQAYIYETVPLVVPPPSPYFNRTVDLTTTTPVTTTTTAGTVIASTSTVEQRMANGSARVQRRDILNMSTLVPPLPSVDYTAATAAGGHKQLPTTTRSIKQSYMTLQIISLFAFFICFILSYLIKLQFKYHRIALNLFDYDIDTYANSSSGGGGGGDRDGDGIDSISSTTPSHFSSSAANNKRFANILKRLLHKLMTKFATILLYFLFGYQFCQNCFIQQTEADIRDGYTIFVHIFILVCVTGRILIVFLTKKYSMNQINYLKELQQKQKELMATASTVSASAPGNKKSREYYYFYYYTYLLKSNQLAFNQLKQHENSQNTFRIFKLNDTALFIGFMAALFHLFSFIRAFELCFDFLPLLFILILLRLKSYLNASLNLVIIFVSLLIISSFSSFNSITNISDYVLKSAAAQQQQQFSSNESSSGATSNATLVAMATIDLPSYYRPVHSSIINLFSYNLMTFFCFLVTFYLNSLLSIYFCSLSCLERWNLSFLCKISFWRKLSIFLSFIVYLIFVLTCTIAICIRFRSWSFLILPIFFSLSFVWCLFQLLNTINLSHLMNKISDCYLLLNESSNLNNINSAENASSHSHSHSQGRKSKSQSSHMISSQSQHNAINNPLHGSLNGIDALNSGNRNSALSQSSSTNNNAAAASRGALSNFKVMKFLTRFLSYDKLNMKPGTGSNAQLHSINIPIHRILAFKGIRHLGSISYRISLFCFILTLALAPFAFTTESPFTIGVYLISLCLNFIWLSLLYQFSKTTTGSCIAYALVSPPHFVAPSASNFATSGGSTMFRTAPGTLASTNVPTMMNNAKKYRTNSSSAYTSSTGTTGTTSSSRTALTTTTTTTNSSSIYLPFNIQQALSRRCTYILSKIHVFLQFHFIENYGCDFAGNTLSKELLETKLRAFFQKRTPDGAAFNTYVLYYCGPTSAKTGDWSLADGSELGIEHIVNCWKEINCSYVAKKTAAAAQNTVVGGGGDSTEEGEDVPIRPNPAGHGSVDTGIGGSNVKPVSPSAKKNNSRLIIILDSENTSKSLQYVNSKLNESNIYVALQTVKYNYNNSSNNGAAAADSGSDSEKTKEPAGVVAKSERRESTKPAPPVSIISQTISSQAAAATNTDNLIESYLNIGKFTLDWIKSNCNSYSIDMYDHHAGAAGGNLEELLNQNEPFMFGARTGHTDYDLDEEREYIYENGGGGRRHRRQRMKELGAGAESDDEDDEDEDEEDDYEDDDDSTADEYNVHTNTMKGDKSGGGGGRTARRLTSQYHQDPYQQQSRHLSSTARTGGKSFKSSSQRSSTFYEAKCAFSRYWTDFAFDANEKTAAQDVSQFWRIYYPYFICKPLLKLVNCRLFYIRFGFLKRILYFLRRVKIRIIPLREFDTGHGFKLFSS